jgi:hypothetical protein
MIKSITPCGDDMLTVELQCTHVHYDGLNGVARCYFPGGLTKMTIAELQEHRKREFAEKYEWCEYELRRKGL